MPTHLSRSRSDWLPCSHVSDVCPEGSGFADAGPWCMQVLQSYLGQAISGAVAHVTDTYAILHFQVELDNGRMECVPGMLHCEDADIADAAVRLLPSVTVAAQRLPLACS